MQYAQHSSTAKGPEHVSDSSQIGFQHALDSSKQADQSEGRHTHVHKAPALNCLKVRPVR